MEVSAVAADASDRSSEWEKLSEEIDVDNWDQPSLSE
jgi:hypothetical protein